MTLLQPFLSKLASELEATSTRRTRVRGSLLEFLGEMVPTDRGRYTLDRHAPLREIVELLERIVTHRETDSRVDAVKGEQLAVTTTALGFALWLAAQCDYNVGYFLPDDKFASEFGMARLNPIVDGSEYLSVLMKDAAVDRGVLKQLGEKYLYLIGLAKIKGATSRPMDVQISDEVDLTSEKVRKWKSGRMSASPLRLELDFSAPYRQDSGIDARYKAGSQRKWLVRCVACGKDEICLEEIMDLTECFRNFNGTWVRVCPSCHKKLDITANGRWVAAQPEREKERHYSYRISTMAVEAIDANFIMKEYLAAMDDPEAMAIFDRTRRGIANAGALQPFTDVQLRKMERDYVLKCERTANPIFCGGDVGNACWIWFEEWLPEGRPRLVWAEKIHSDRYVERSIELIGRFQPRFGVFDKMPLFTDSRKIAYAFPRTIALLQFDNGKEPYMLSERVTVEGTLGAARTEYGPEYLCIKGDRNIILGAFAAEATHPDRGLLIPSERGSTMDTLRAHLKKGQKEVIKDAKGNEVHQFLENVENHWLMAGAASRIARQFAPNVLPFVHTPLPTRSRASELRSVTQEETRKFGSGDRRSRMKGAGV